MKLKKKLLSIMFFFVLLSVTGQTNNQSLEEKFETSIKCYSDEVESAPQEALKCSHDALAIARLLNDDRKTLEALFNIAYSFSYLDQFQAAFEHAYQGLELSDQIGDSFSKARFESLCGTLNLALNKPDEALPYLESSLNYYRLTDEVSLEYITLGNMTNAFSLKKEYAKINPILKDIKAYYAEKNDTVNYITSVLNLSDLYRNTHEIDSALAELTNLNGYQLDDSFRVIEHHSKGEIYYDKAEFDTAITHLEKAKRLVQSLNDITQEEPITKILASTYFEIQDFEKASLLYKRNAELKDSILTVKAQERLQELEAVYQVAQKEKEIAALLETKKTRNQQITWLIVFVMFTLMVLLLLYLRTKSKIKLASLTNKLLTQELTHKKSELTNLAVHYSEVNKLMRTVQMKASSLHRIADPNKLQTKITEITDEFGVKGSLVKNHKNIENHIDASYSDFMFSLEKLSSELTNKEKRICSLILVNCSSKEIADILSISPKSINNSRSTIRKKLNISEKENMSVFFNKLIE